MERERLSWFFVIASFILALVAGPIGYGGQLVSSEDRFVAVTTEVLRHPDVREATAQQATTLTIESLGSDSIADTLPGETRALFVPITRVASGVVTEVGFNLLDTDAFRQVLDPALREVHQQLTADGDEVTIDLRPVIVRVGREVAGPTAGSGLTQYLVKTDRGRYTIAEEGSSTADTFAAIRTLPTWGLFTGLATLAAVLLAIVADPNPRRAAVRSGVAVAAGATVAIIVLALVLEAVLTSSDVAVEARVGQGIADSLAADFAQQQLSAVVGGLALAAVGLVLGRRPSAVAIRSLVRSAWSRDRHGAATAIDELVGDNPPMARILVWAAMALVLIAWPEPTPRVVVSVLAFTLLALLAVWLVSSPHRLASSWRERLGVADLPTSTVEIAEAHHLARMNLTVLGFIVFLLWPDWDRDLVVTFAVVVALIQVVLDIGPARQLTRLNAGPDTAPEPTSGRSLAVLGAVVLVIVGGAIAWILVSNDVAEADAGCNGHVELCDRTVDTIVWAGSHNSMSSNDLGWELAAQRGDIIAQLDHGVRALLIDTHYWDGSGAFEGGDDEEAAAVIAAAVADDVPRPGTWLCHGPCALGATELESAFSEIDLWLDENPRSVLILIVQDEISTEDTMEVFEASGLTQRIHEHVPGTPWPTLGELIEREERLLVFAENEGSADSWYQNAWTDNFFDTPFSFPVPEDFSCDLNRGVIDNDLFLINHWLTTGIPLEEAAAAVNSESVLLGRVEACQEEHGRLPTVIAVDFVEVGDLVDVVDTLNEVG